MPGKRQRQRKKWSTSQIRIDHMNIALDKWLKYLYNEFGFSENKFSKGEALCFLVVKKSRS